MLLNAFIDARFPRISNCHTFLGAKKFTQVLDITHLVQVAIEKGQDHRSQCSIAQSDIATYYNSLPMDRLVRWLLDQGAPPSLVFAAVRHQTMTTIRVAVQHSASSFAVQARHICGLTGSHTAVALARIPTEEMVSVLRDTIKERAFLGKVSLGVFVDNLVSIGNSVSGSIYILH